MIWYERIRGLREDKDLTQTDMAKILNTSQRTVSNWESGRNQPPYETLILYAMYFNVSTDYILCITNDTTPRTPSRNIKNNIEINFGNVNMN